MDEPMSAGQTLPTKVPAIAPDGRLQHVRLRSPAQGNVTRNVLSCAARGLPMIAPLAEADRVAVVVGTGPSLDRRENRRMVKRLADKGAVVYALKSAATLLRDAGIPVHYVLNCDAQANQVAKMPAYPGPTYLLGSCCDPVLFDHVLAAGCRVEVFHSATGARVTDHGSEEEFYAAHFAHAWVAQGGMTVANRAIACAYYHGCRKVHIAGVDLGVRTRDQYYATGASGRLGNGVLWINDGAQIDGRTWYTQPSLLVSAVSAARLVLAGFVEVIGDSLVQALAKNPQHIPNAVQGVA